MSRADWFFIARMVCLGLWLVLKVVDIAGRK